MQYRAGLPITVGHCRREVWLTSDALQAATFLVCVRGGSSLLWSVRQTVLSTSD